MKCPTRYRATHLLTHYPIATQLPSGEWVPARPMLLHVALIPGFMHRLRCAWAVFTAQADVLEWDGQPGVLTNNDQNGDTPQ